MFVWSVPSEELRASLTSINNTGDMDRESLLNGEMGATLGAHSVRQQITLQPRTKAVDKKPYLQSRGSPKTVGFSDDDEQYKSRRENDGTVENGFHGKDGRDGQDFATDAVKVSPGRRNRITLNVSGFKFQTYIDTLQKFPNTLLGNSEKRSEYYDRELHEYFFDRNKQVFEIILYFYQSNGRLVCPPDLAPEILLEEVEFFELGETAINAVKELLTDEEPDEEVRELPKNQIQQKIWNLFEYADSGKAARIVALFSISIIVASIIVLCAETLPNFRVLPESKNPNNTAEVERIRKHNQFAKTGKTWFRYLESAFIAWFTLEYLVRFFSSPRKLVFVRSFLNVIDILAIVPFYIDLIIQNVVSDSETLSLAFLRILRLVRVFRIFKLSRHSSGLQILGLTLRKSLRELGLLVFFLIIGVVIFSSMAYYAESGEPDTHLGRSIPDAFWWAVVTMTTVGYGDLVPKTLFGKLVGSCCAICGVLAIALPVPVIVSNFDAIYKKHRSRKIKQGSDDDESKKISIMVSSASSSSFNDEESSSPTFERKSNSEETPLWSRKENPLPAKKKLNGNLLPGKDPEEEKLLTNGNYLAGNVDDETQNEKKNPTEFEMEQLRDERESNPEADSENNGSTRV
ncbi:shaker-related potassium channel tsha2-like isoform X1 [Actinia tenebrosa]|uniref:Shaker-related potassium channel tsha2-like isoform X1 n=1 Tax=Actinia tenebrosa TaxID=6105 RepID=A0A6P8HXZ0_ACTTE|nr:shaker-related potassium channel tsha2-like isoform X1 [Actinia tenebrosa]